MTNIDHLSESERRHFILCDCGEYMDMRDLSDVFRHLHSGKTPPAQWSHSIRKNEPAAYAKNGRRLDLN